MSLRDALRNAFDNLAGHPLRTGLTMLGMVFGVAAVIGMLSIGEGAERQALEMIERLGVRNVLVRDAGLTGAKLDQAREVSPGLSPRDATAILDAVPGVDLAVMRVEIDPYVVLSDGVVTEAAVHGVGWQYAELTNLVVVEGRFFDRTDERNHAQVCVIGRTVRRELFGFEPVLGRDLKINDLWLEVVGVLEGTGSATTVQGVAVGSADQEIYLPVSTAIRKLDLPWNEAPLDEIILRLEPEVDARETAQVASNLLDRLHGGAADFEFLVPDALLEESRRTQRLFSIVMGCIAGISLVVGGIGIANIMLATVFERTREIGVRRAVGATRDDIRTLFLMESFAISVLGGLAGVLMGILISQIVAASAGWPTVVTLFSVVLSFGVSVVVGIVSGLQPALRAASLNPIDALHHE